MKTNFLDSVNFHHSSQNQNLGGLKPSRLLVTDWHYIFDPAPTDQFHICHISMKPYMNSITQLYRGIQSFPKFIRLFRSSGLGPQLQLWNPVRWRWTFRRSWCDKIQSWTWRYRLGLSSLLTDSRDLMSLSPAKHSTCSKYSSSAAICYPFSLLN